MSSSQVEMLRKVYSHVDDVDLYLGGLMEKPMPGSLLGQTFSCIVADQMFRAVVGDRFFHSLHNSDNGFSQGEDNNSYPSCFWIHARATHTHELNLLQV